MDTVLSRFWADGGEALSEVVALAGAEPGPDGSAAVRSGLEALGAGLSADGDPENWTVRKEVAVAVAGSLGNGVAANVEVATDALLASVDGELGERNDDILRGLGYLTLDRDAADTVGSALCSWAGGQPLSTGESVDGASRGALAIPGAYVAVQEYGQRLAYAMHGFQAQAAAETAETAWKWTWGLAVEFVRGPLGIPAGVAVDYAAIFLGADGTWDNGIDGGLVLSREDAVREAIDRLGPEDAAAARELGVQTRAAYDHTADALGLPKPPMSEKSDYLEPLFDAAADVGLDKIQDAAKAGGAGLRVGSGG